MKTIFTFLAFFGISAWSFAQWTQVPVPTTDDLLAVMFSDTLHGYTTGNSLIIKTSDGGSSWEEVFTCVPPAFITDIKFPTPTTGYAVGDYLIVKSTDGGDTWTQIPAPTGSTVRGAWFMDKNVGLICGQGSEIWRTTDGGSTWSQLTEGAYWLRRFSFPAALTGYCVGDGHTIYKSTDAGISWTLQMTDGSPNLTDVLFLSADTGFVCGLEGYIAKTTDGGANWQPQVTGTTGGFSAIVAIDRLHLYCVGENGLILKTYDGGETWSAEPSGTTNYLRGICFTNNKKGFICGHSGTLLQSSLVGIQEKERSVSIFPNPCKDKIFISRTGVNGPMKILVYNAMGEIVLDQTINGGSGNRAGIVFNLPAGLYLAVGSDKNGLVFREKLIVSH
jgi:photosystem II stability/assembly factor-like uncharacterized protein